MFAFVWVFLCARACVFVRVCFVCMCLCLCATLLAEALLLPTSLIEDHHGDHCLCQDVRTTHKQAHKYIQYDKSVHQLLMALAC